MVHRYWQDENNKKYAVFMCCHWIKKPKRFKGAVSRNSAKLGNYKMPVKLRET